jgi:hypothetical protein
MDPVALHSSEEVIEREVRKMVTKFGTQVGAMRVFQVQGLPRVFQVSARQKGL